jgi:hypothetical protein
MAYLGNVPARSFISFERQVFTIVNSQTAYTLDHSVTNENDLRLVINNIVQEPGSGKAYTASGTTLTLSAALVNGTDEMYCVFLGRAVGTVNAPAGSVSTSQLASDAVTAAKLNSTAITGQTAEATVANDDTVLIHDTSASALRKMTVSNLTANAGISGWSANGSNNDLLPGNASAGIYLGVNSATAANLLDDYEEGTWTPTAKGGSTAGTEPTGNGRYTKVGNLVHVDFSFVNVTIGSASGDLQITNLPFTVSGANSVRGSFGGNIRFYNYNLSGNTYYQLTLVADENVTHLIVTQTRDDATWSTLGIDNDSSLYFEGGITYTTTA